MMNFVVILQVILFAVALNAASSTYTGGSRGGYGERSTPANVSDKDKGHKIVVIKLEDAFGKVAEDLEMIKEMNVDIKLIKVLLEQIVPDILEIRKSLPELNSLGSSTQEVREMRRYSPSASRLSSSSNNSQDIWDSIPKSNCAEIRLKGQAKSGMYAIQPDRTKRPIAVYCDMENEGGGWTTIQRRGVLDVPKRLRESFYRNWEEYENGFGNPEKDYWIGLENIHAMTKDCNHELLVNITAWDGISKYSKYSRFNLTGKEDFYRLYVGGYSGNAGDALLHHNSMRFTTFDRQNDMNGDDNCARLYRGAWWYKDCFWSNLNGEYADDGSNGKMTTRHGIEWGARHFYSLMKTEMKIKPKC